MLHLKFPRFLCSAVHGADIGTLGLMECKQYVLYVIRKRWSRFRCTVWKNRILGKFVKNALSVVCDVTIRFHVPRQIYFPQQILFMVNDDLSWRITKDNVRNIHWMFIKKRIWLWTLISTKETAHVFTHKTRFPLHFPTNNAFFCSTMWGGNCPSDLGTLSWACSQK